MVQKSLGRLETLTRREREGALSVLLNLGRLSKIESTLRPTREHEDEVRRAEGIAGMAAVEAERTALSAQLDEQQRLAALARLRDDLAALDTAADHAAAAAADRTTAERDLAAATARLEAISEYRTQRQAWLDLSGTVQRLSEAEQQLTAAAATLAATEQEAAKLAAAKAQAAAAYDLSTRVEAIRVAEETCTRRAGEHEEAQRQVAECATWRVERREVSQQLAELEQTIEIAEARRKLHDAEQEYARLAEEHRETQQRVAQCDAWRSARRDVAQQLAGLERTIAIAMARQQLRDVEQEYARLAEEHREAQQRVEQCAAWRGEQREVAERLAELEQAIVLVEEQRRNRAERERLIGLRNNLEDWAQIASQRAGIQAARRRLNVAGGSAGVLTVALVLLLVASAPLVLIAVCLVGWLGALLTSTVLAANAGLMPGMSQTNATRLDARLQSAAEALYEQGEATPLTAPGVQQRLASADDALAALADDGRGAVDEAGYRDLLGRRGQLQRQGEELASSLEQEPALKAAAVQAGELLMACQAEVAAQRQALVAQLGGDGAGDDDGRGAVDEAGFRDLLGQRGQLQRQREELASNLERESALKTAAVQAGELLMACQAEVAAQRQALVAQLGGDGAGDDDGHGAVDEVGFQDLIGRRGQLQRQAEELVSNLEREPTLKTAAVQAGEALTACRADLDDQWQTLTARLGRDYARDHRAAAQAIRARVQRAEQERASTAAAAARLPPRSGRRWGGGSPAARSCRKRSNGGLLLSMPPCRRKRTLSGHSLGRSYARSRQKSLGLILSKRQRRSNTPCSGAARRLRARSKPWQTDTGWPRRRLNGPAAWGATLADVAEVWQRAAQIRDALPSVTEPLPPTEAIEAQVSELRERLVRCDQDIRRTWEDLALPADYVVPGVAEADEAAREAHLELQSRRYAVQVLTQARRKMIANVLPSTERNMCLLLPELTAGRYRHARLDQDYRFQVWDERKRGDTEKKLLSGGTQDQFSLALRLGFAIAALPQEVGTRPGFPLSRRAAVELRPRPHAGAGQSPHPRDDYLAFPASVPDQSLDAVRPAPLHLSRRDGGRWSGVVNAPATGAGGAACRPVVGPAPVKARAWPSGAWMDRGGLRCCSIGLWRLCREKGPDLAKRLAPESQSEAEDQWAAAARERWYPLPALAQDRSLLYAVDGSGHVAALNSGFYIVVAQAFLAGPTEADTVAEVDLEIYDARRSATDVSSLRDLMMRRLESQVAMETAQRIERPQESVLLLDGSLHCRAYPPQSLVWLGGHVWPRPGRGADGGNAARSCRADP